MPSADNKVSRLEDLQDKTVVSTKGSTPLKALTLRQLIQSKQINAIYAKWFASPIPPKNAVLNLPESYLLREYWAYPTDFVPM